MPFAPAIEPREPLVPRASLERVMSAIDVAPGVSTRRHGLAAGSRLVTPHPAAFAYVVDGAVEVEHAAETGCDGGDASPVLHAGDALVSLASSGVSLTAADSAVIVVASFSLRPAPLGDSLPELIHVSGFARAEPSAAALATTLGMDAGGISRSGDPVICRLMVSTVLLAIVRSWAQQGCAPRGWPREPRDPFLPEVAAAVRDSPGCRWTLGTMAAAGAMSRSAFAARFRNEFGMPPAEYVTAVRMHRARDLLAAGATVSHVARELGYASDEGFSRAFRRSTGVTPSRWHGARASASAI